MPARGQKQEKHYSTEPSRIEKDPGGLEFGIYEPIEGEYAEKLKLLVLNTLRRGHFVAEIPELCKITLTTLHWMKLDDPTFAAEFEEAKSVGILLRLGEWKDWFLEALRERYNVGRACRIAGVNRGEVSKAIKDSAEFRAAYNEIRLAAIDDVEESLHDKAMGTGKEAATAAAIFLNANRSRKYKRNGKEAENQITGPVNVTYVFNVSPKPDEPKRLAAQSGKEIDLDA